MIRLPFLLELADEARINLAIWGTHGIGKTSIIQQYADKVNAHLETIILSTTDPVVLGGFPGRSHDEKDRVVMDVAAPDWVIRLQDAGGEYNKETGLSKKRTILFLDEFNRADRFCHNAAMTLVLDKRIHNHHLPPDCFIVVAMNPETQGDMGVNPLTDPMIDRFCHIGVGHTESLLAKGFSEWGKKAGINKHILDYIQMSPKILTNFPLDFDEAIGNRIGPTPRSWVAVARVMDALTDEEGNIDTGRLTSHGAMLIGGLIGKGNVAPFQKYVSQNFDKPFTY